MLAESFWMAVDLGREMANGLEIKAGTQKRALGRPEKWADRNLTKFNQGTCEFLHLGLNNPMEHQGWGLNLRPQLCRQDGQSSPPINSCE